MNVPTDEEIKRGLEFILTHFAAFGFPRTISTKTTEGRQLLVNNRAEALARFKQANYLDCRINAYSNHDIKGDPNFIFIDIDSTDKILLDKVLTGKFQSIEAHPTVLYTGNGFHIYQSIKSICLDEVGTFSTYSNPSRQFLKFAETYLSNNECDPNHNPSFKSCLVRIPNSVNSKNGMQVEIVQSWNGQRPDIRLLLGSFYAWILTEAKKQQEKISKIITNSNFRKSEIKWIENSLLKTPIEDYRKNAIALILAPYLINIRKISYDNSFSIIKKWLTTCNELRHLDSNFDDRIKTSLYTAMRKQTLPMRLDTLEDRNRELHRLLTEKTKVEGTLK